MQQPLTPSTPEALLEHLEWVRRLARGLVADPNAADDLVQDTWLSAARRPPEAGNLRSWLATVVRNAARDRGRRESRRALHEARAASADAVAASTELTDRVAMQQAVVQRVLELDEPYRETVLLRYFQELTPGEIAERMGVPLATVKTRLRRALAELRTRLDRAHGGDGRAWLAALMPLAKATDSIGTGALILMNSKTIAWAAAAVVTLAAVGVFFVQSGLQPEPQEDSDAPLVALAGVEDSPDAPVPVETNRGEPRVAAAVDVTRDTAAEGTQRVLVVDGATGAPVPGADVWIVDSDWRGWPDQTANREEHARSQGAHRSADALGEVALPVSDRWTRAVARSGASYGERGFTPTGVEPVRIELQPEVSVRVQVVDAAGEPRVDVPVAMRTRTSSSPPQTGLVELRARTRAPDGIAVLAHLFLSVPELSDGGLWCVAELEGAFAPPVQVEFDPHRPPTEPLRLVLPPSGRIVALVQDAQGRPARNGWVHFTPVVPEVGVRGLEMHGARTDVMARNGRAELEQVGLGLDLLVNTQPSEERPPIATRLVGPRTAGDEVVVTLRLGEPYPVLVGTLSDTSGAPMPGQSIGARVVLDRQGQPMEELQVGCMTDESARFRLAIPAHWEPLVRARVHLRIVDREETVSSADIAPPEPLRSGDIDVGNVVVGPPPVVLSGTVREPDGTPIFGAIVDVAKLCGPDDPTGSPYTWVAGGRATTDRQGRFTVTGVLPPGDYVAQVGAGDFAAPGMRAFVVGSRNWDAVLERLGALGGSVLLTEGIRPELIVVEANVRPSDPTVSAHVRYATQLHPDGSFRLERLPPGLADVHLHLEGDPEMLATIASVSIPSGGVATDARLRPVDLRELVQRQLEISIVGPDEQPVASAVVAIRPAGDRAGPSRRILCEDGQLTILSRSPAVDLELHAHGMRVATREAVATDQTIVMEAALPITVQLPAAFELPGAPIQLALILCPASIEASTLLEPLYLERGGYNYNFYNWFMGQAPKFGADREVRLQLPHAGAYRIDWMVSAGAVGTQSIVPLRSTEGFRELRVLESDAGKVFELAPNPAELATALAELRAR